MRVSRAKARLGVSYSMGSTRFLPSYMLINSRVSSRAPCSLDSRDSFSSSPAEPCPPLISATKTDVRTTITTSTKLDIGVQPGPKSGQIQTKFQSYCSDPNSIVRALSSQSNSSSRPAPSVISCRLNSRLCPWRTTQRVLGLPNPQL